MEYLCIIKQKTTQHQIITADLHIFCIIKIKCIFPFILVCEKFFLIILI